jgi:O-antigen ligase
MDTIVNPSDDYNVTSETGRLAIWKRGLANLARAPVTGVGIGNFARAQWVYRVYTRDGTPIRALSPHNTFLQVAVDLGVPAFLVFMSIVYGATVGFARIRSRLPRSWLGESAERRFAYLAASYLPVAFLGWSAGAFFVSHAYLVPFYALVAFAAGFLFLLRRELRSAGRDASSPAPPRMGTPRRYVRP